MKFRNYVPHDKELQEGKLVPPVLPKFEDPVATEPPQLKEVVFSVLLLYVLKLTIACTCRIFCINYIPLENL